MTTADLEDMLAGYVTCALWASIDEQPDGNGGPPMDANYGPDDLAPEALASMREDCEAFAESEADDLADLSAAQAGHDFWLTRNRHGAGFWDRGLGDRGDRLTKAAHVYGESDLYVGDDGKVYVT